jgi:ComF family protein
MTSTSIFKRGGILHDIRHLIFPQKCLSCEVELTGAESTICSLCKTNFTETNFHLSKEPTMMDKIFWGRVQIHKTYALFFFEKAKTAQKVLFQLKYKNNQAVGHHFGQEIAKRIQQNPEFDDVDVFIPVPLHPKKEFIRGYNQSEALAYGITQELDIPMDIKSLKRVQHGKSQTSKSRMERWTSIQSTFQIKPSIKKYKHIVLVDDVITTGSTIEVIAAAILEKHPEVKISVVTLAIT